MPNTVSRFFITLAIYLSVCACTFFFISPYSFTSFVGAAAGITTALVVFWGASILSAIVVGTVFFSLFLYFWGNLPIESSMVIITLLALILQGFWARQLTLAEVNQQNWLKSRRDLLRFLFKVGPLISLVSAFSVIILTMLENKVFGLNLFFTFASCWSVSVLFSVFFTPLLLLSQARQQLSSSKRVFIIVASLLALVSIALLFNISQNVQQHQREDDFNQVKNNVVQKIQQEVAITHYKLNSLSAFFNASDEVTRNEFDLYSRQILQKESSIRVLEWAPIINHDDRAEFEQYFAYINEKSLTGTLQKAAQRSRYAPIKYIYPLLKNEQVLGLDVLTNPKSIIDMAKVIRQQGIIASAPISLIQDEYANLGVLFILGVFSELNQFPPVYMNTSAQKQTKDLLGFLVAVVQFESFFQQISPLQTNNISLFIEDITSPEPYILFGKQLNVSYRHVETSFMNVNSRTWRISLGENEPWQMQEKNWQIWAMLFGTTLGGMLFQVLILMMAVYSSELSSQVISKTRELFIAKEQSEHKNTAKTKFLYTLTSELQTPLQAMTHFTEQLSATEFKDQQKIIQNIELAQHNMHKLLHMVVDLSKIELGELSVKNEPLDFYGFLERIDSMLKAKESNQDKSISILIDPSVPHFINSDELRIQQLLMAFCDGIHKLYSANTMRLSIKVHQHQSKNATLLFVFTRHDNDITDVKAEPQQFNAKDFSLYSTELAMAKEVCQLMGGDANFAVSASGKRILTASIKIAISSNEQQRAYQAQTFDDNRHEE